MKKILLSVTTCMLGATMLFAQSAPTLTQKWIKSVTTGNFEAPGAEVRGMATANGKLYFSDRGDAAGNAINVYDAATGAFLKKVALPATIAEGTSISNNCLRADNAGNLVISNLNTNLTTTKLQVWAMANEDAAPVLILDQAPINAAMFGALVGPRIDHIGVYGDVTKNGYILAALSTDDGLGAMVLQWIIKDGAIAWKTVDSNIVKEPYQFFVDQYVGSSAANAAGSSPFILPLSDNLFYLDGSSTIPTVYALDTNSESAVCETGFYTKNDKGEIVVTDVKPDAAAANGIAQVELGNRTFVVVSNQNHGGVDAAMKHTFKLIELGAGMDFSSLNQIATFPDGGLGGVANSGIVMIPLIEKVDETKANIYIYAYKNGYAKYELTLGTTGINTDNISAQEPMICKDGKIYLPEVAKSVEVYNISGQKVAEKANTEIVNAPASKGLYIVKAVYQNGTTATQKVSVN